MGSQGRAGAGLRGRGGVPMNDEAIKQRRLAATARFKDRFVAALRREAPHRLPEHMRRDPGVTHSPVSNWTFPDTKKKEI